MRRHAAPREIPPPLELECLKVLWDLGQGNVRDVQTALKPKRTLAYTTVLTLLDRLTKRGAAERNKQGRNFIYSPKVKREALAEAALKELLENYFHGSEEALRLKLEQLAAAAEAARAGETGGMEAALL